MKTAVALALLPLLAVAAPHPVEVRDDSDDPNAVVKFDAFATASTVDFPEGTGTYVGQENSTDVSLFRFADGNVYSVSAVQGDQLTFGPFGTFAATVGRNGLCNGCTDESGKDTKRTIEERTGLLFALIACKIKIIEAFFDWFRILLGCKIYTGCLNGYPGGGHVWVGGGHGQQCGVSHGYVHYPHIPHLGWDNGYGGKYCGSYKGIQFWKWNDGRVCGINVHRHRRRPGCSVPQRPNKPPVCNVCHDPSEEWWNTQKPGYWNNRHWWGSRSINELD